MSKLKTNAIENIAGDKTVTLDQLHSFVGVPLGFKNKLINGDFAIWQRGTSQSTSSYGSDDRWLNENAGTTKVHSQQIATDTERALFNSNYFSRTVVTSVAGAGNLCEKNQRIEDITKLAGKTVTVSFWAKADTSKNIAIEFLQSFGSGGTPSSNVDGIGSQLIALTTTWAKYSITVTIPSIIGKTLGTDGTHTSFTAFYFWFDAGSTYDVRTASLGQQSGTFDIAEVQIEEGSVATPFEQRPIGLELSLCKRYYQILPYQTSKSFVAGDVNTSRAIAGTYPSMRVTPTASYTWAEMATITSVVFTTNSFRGYGSSNFASNFAGFTINSLDAEL